MGSREDEEEPLLDHTPLPLPQHQNEDRDSTLYAGDGSVDIHKNPVLKSKTGKWKACPSLLGTGCLEHLAYYGIATNLVTYLIDEMHQSNVAAAKNINIWKGTCYLTPVVGALIADAYWGRYWTITAFFTVDLLGMIVLTLSASIPALEPAACVDSVCPSATTAQYAVFFFALYFIALGSGAIKPCLWPFGADQFDDTDPEEKVGKGGYFNWLYFAQNLGAVIASTLLVWIQENAGWAIGFGIPTIIMAFAIASFLFGTPNYRFQKPGGSPLTRVCQVFVASIRKWNLKVPEDSTLLYEVHDMNSAIQGSRKIEHSSDMKCLDKAALISNSESGEYDNLWNLCTVTQVEELKILIRMIPIWATGIIFSAVYAQMSTLFVEQGKMMDRTIGSLTIPSASLSCFDFISVILWAAFYDKAIIPIARRFTDRPRGFSELQRMGIGLFISILCMFAAAILEIKRLQLAKELDLVDEDVAVPISILWQIPQYFLLGAAEVFTFIGQHEFFYEQAPDAMRSLCSALSLLTNALGNYLSSLILTLITYFSTEDGSVGWIPDNLNEGHLDYVFWLLAGLSFANLLVYVFFSRRYKEKKVNSN